MRTQLNDNLVSRETLQRADGILRSCVHCGFCNAACPTYALTGNELDGPRGRIYLVKGLLENQESSALTRTHLDRCLSCRACESACPSGVEYHVLADIGREVVQSKVPFPSRYRRFRRAIAWVFGHSRRLKRLLLPLWVIRPVLTPSLKRRLPSWRERRRARPVKGSDSKRAWILLEGCVQQPVAPEINHAAHQLFRQAEIPLRTCEQANCCGALPFHLGRHDEARRQVEANILAWDSKISAGAPGVISAASGCAAFMATYPEIVRSSPAIVPAAKRVAAAVREPAEVLLGARRWIRSNAPLADLELSLHQPCSLTHGLNRGGAVLGLLESLGVTVKVPRDGPPCCGSAGAYSLLHPRIGAQLRTGMLNALSADASGPIATSNIGCRLHLQAGTPVPVKHWLEHLVAAIERREKG